MICNAICEKKKKTEIHKVFQRDRDSKESMQTITFFFLWKEYFQVSSFDIPLSAQDSLPETSSSDPVANLWVGGLVWESY